MLVGGGGGGGGGGGPTTGAGWDGAREPTRLCKLRPVAICQWAWLPQPAYTKLRELQQLRPEVTAHMVLLPVQHRLAEELLDLLLGAVGSVGDGGTNRLERLVWEKVEDIQIGP